ncbi:MAG: hypothetical protein GKC04_05380, partial [Methanomicrobiales archaeon]|nr:hypothetical protein [Methanomicrobiales archaeon]
MPDAPPGGGSAEEAAEQEQIPYEAELARIRETIEAFEAGKRSHIAVISDPFAGQSALINAIRSEYEERVFYFSFQSVVSRKEFLAAIRQEKDIIIIDRCHFLALRKVGGFDILDEFLHLLSGSDRLFITSWNSFSWSYLDAIRNISAYFPIVLHLPRLDVATLKSIILSRYSDEIQFVDDTPRTERRAFFLSWNEKEVAGRTIRYPVPVVNPEYLLHTRDGRYEDSLATEDLIFRRIHRISDGNLGIATKIWEKSLSYPTVHASAIPAEQCVIDLSVNESFLLLIIL